MRDTTPLRLVFLDVDGVLNHDGNDWSKGPIVLDAACLDQLVRIVIATGCRIILSSTWRLHGDGREALYQRFAALGIIGRLLGETPDLRTYSRNHEIRTWLRDHGGAYYHIANYAVLDDYPDADLGDGSFFETSPRTGGLTAEIADRVIAHFTKIVVPNG